MKRKFLLLAAILFTLSNKAQTKTNEQSTPTPSRIKVYSPNSSFSSKPAPKDNSYKWAVKTDLTAMVVGEFPIIAEYRFAEKFSIEGSAAITYAFWPNESLFNDNYASDFGEGKADVGNAFRGTIKYYPSSDYDAIEGWYFGIQLFTKTTNRITQATNYNDNTVTEYKDSKTKNGISLIIGKQIFEDSNIALESFIGIGLASVTHEYPTQTYDNNGNSSIQRVTTKDNVPNFQLGFRIGFGN